MKNSGKGGGSKTNAKAGPGPGPCHGQEIRRDRKSATGINGSPKKGGHGGKFTWSGDGYSDAELGRIQKGVLDVNDPNYEDPVKNEE